MKTHLAMFCSLALVVGSNEATLAEATSNEVTKVTATPALSAAQKQAYALGIMSARQIKTTTGIEDLDVDFYSQGFRAGYTQPEGKLLLSDKEMQEAMMAMRESAMKKQRKLLTDGQTKGDAYLQANAAKPGVNTTASGLQYEVIKEGSGTTPKDNDTVKVSYKGSLVSGAVFDQNDSATFGVGQVIPGWTEALKMMKVGSKYQLAIPSKLAYGERGAGSRIPPNSTLLFEVELLEIQPAVIPNKTTSPVR
jgi:FKBP-type peptidyl-prolyl cis-trans isomerase FklB